MNADSAYSKIEVKATIIKSNFSNLKLGRGHGDIIHVNNKYPV